MSAHALNEATTRVACPDCDTLHRLVPYPAPGDALCTRCGRTLVRRTLQPINRTLAYALAGLLLMLPANIYPIVTFGSYGVTNRNDLITGPLSLINQNLPFVGVLVFLTSIFFPILFLLGLAYVSFWAKTGHYPADYALALRWTQGLYRWAMIDVFLLACLVAFIKLGLTGIVSFGRFVGTNQSSTFGRVVH